MKRAEQERSREKARAIGISVALGAYFVLEWLFAFASQAEGLVSPAGNPNLAVVAVGVAYVVARLVVRAVLPIVATVLIVGAVRRRWFAGSGNSG